MSTNTDQIAGRVKQAAGDLTDDDELNREGERQEMTGKAKEKVDDAADKVQDAIDDASEKIERKFD